MQQEEYYPFGLRFNSYTRENALINKMKLFQDQEHIDDLGLNWDSFKWRNHQPDIGRFFSIDPISEKYYYNSPYAFAENKLGLGIELEGLELYRMRGNELEVAQANGQVPSDYKPTVRQEIELAGGVERYAQKRVMDGLGTPTISISASVNAGATDVKIIKNVEGHSATILASEVASGEIKFQKGEDTQSSSGGYVTGEKKFVTGFSVAREGGNVELAGSATMDSDGNRTLEYSTTASIAGFGVTKTYTTQIPNGGEPSTTMTTRTGFNVGGGAGTGIAAQFNLFIGFEKKQDVPKTTN